MNQKKKPLFRRTQGATYNKLKRKGWRRPDGKHNKMRTYKKGKGEAPKIGYGANRGIRNLHPSGLEDVIISSLKDVKAIEASRQAARISSTVGKRKKTLILEELKKRKIKILNS